MFRSVISAEILGVRFLDTSSAFLVERFAKEMNKWPEMKRYGVAFAPRVRGYSELRKLSRAGSISPATAGKLEQAARQGYFREGQKQ